jgi:fatty acid desaturase
MKIYKPQNVEINKNGISFLGALTLLFIALKLTGHIAWSWWWVLSPLWIPFAIVLCGFILVLCGIAAKVVYTEHLRKKANKIKNNLK